MPTCNSCGTVVVSDAQLARLVQRHFVGLPRQRIAFAIALAESCGGHSDAWNCTGEDSRGLWQINVAPGANSDLLALGNLFNSEVNARAARIVHDRNGGWCPWSVYEEFCSSQHTGAYRNFLPRAAAALPSEPPNGRTEPPPWHFGGRICNQQGIRGALLRLIGTGRVTLAQAERLLPDFNNDVLRWATALGFSHAEVQALEVHCAAAEPPPPRPAPELVPNLAPLAAIALIVGGSFLLSTRSMTKPKPVV